MRDDYDTAEKTLNEKISIHVPRMRDDSFTQLRWLRGGLFQSTSLA